MTLLVPLRWTTFGRLAPNVEQHVPPSSRISADEVLQVGGFQLPRLSVFYGEVPHDLHGLKHCKFVRIQRAADAEELDLGTQLLLVELCRLHDSVAVVVNAKLAPLLEVRVSGWAFALLRPFGGMATARPRHAARQPPPKPPLRLRNLAHARARTARRPRAAPMQAHSKEMVDGSRAPFSFSPNRQGR